MVDVKGTTIQMTRGDTFIATLTLKYADDTDYTPEEGDEIRFALKRKYTDEETTIYKTIPNDTLILELEPNDTKTLSFGSYVYDIQITHADGKVDTFIDRARLVLTEEVD